MQASTPNLSLMAILLTAVMLIFSATVKADQLNQFTTDGCSMSPDGIWLIKPNAFLHCCLADDIAYWKGGTFEERKKADWEFRSCIRARGGRAAGTIYYNGVRAGGIPNVPTPFRWGYGWNTLRGYQALTPEESALADQLLRQIDWDHIMQPFFQGDGAIYGQ